MAQIKFSEDLINNFLQLQSELTDNAFTMGDLCCQVVDEYSHIAQHADILKALADSTGACYDTLRDRERVARAVSRNARLEFPLSFHQWRSCVKKDTDPLLVADWALTGGRDGGIATVKEIRSHVQGEDDTPLWIKKFERLQEAAQSILELKDTPPHVIDALVQIISIVPIHPPMP